MGPTSALFLPYFTISSLVAVGPASSLVLNSVLKILFLVGPGRYRFQRAGTRVLAPMGDNRRFYKNLHIYKLKTYTNNRIQPFALYLVGHVFRIQNSTTQKKC